MRLLLVLILLGFAAEAQAQTWTFTGQIRHRTEYDARTFDEDAPEVAFHLLRTRLGVGVQPLPDVRVFIQIQDARHFGGGNPALGRGTLDASADALDFHQAYFMVDRFFGTPLGLKLGRQELAYGNERLVGAVDWSNTGRTFDAGVITFRPEGFLLDVFAAQLVGSTVDPAAQHLFGVYGTWPLAPTHTLDLFVLADTDTREIPAGPDEEEWYLARLTPGLYARGTVGPVDYSAEAIYQTGNVFAGPGVERAEIGAHLLSGTLGYTVLPERAARLGLTYTVLSGDEDATDDEVNMFDTLFGTNHKFYGFMDYFPFIPQFRPYGLRDFVLSASINPTPALRLALDFHHFETDAPVNLLVNDDLTTLGQEIDFTAAYRYNDRFSITAGASTFFPGDVVEGFFEDHQTYWLFLMTTVSF